MSTVKDRLEKVLREQFPGSTAQQRDYAAGCLIAELSVEERWVPVAESGERWEPRSREQAAMASTGWPAGGCYEGTDDPYDGIVRVDHEVRWTTEWFVADSVDYLS